MRQKSGKEFDVIVKSRNGKVKLPIVAENVAEALKLAAPVIKRRRLGAVIETKEKPKKP